LTKSPLDKAQTPGKVGLYGILSHPITLQRGVAAFLLSAGAALF
jgi:hypothetical protein